MKKFDAAYEFLKEMYSDDYFPDFLVDKIKAELENVIAFFGNRCYGRGTDSGEV